jgi:hypothetical protein
LQPPRTYQCAENVVYHLACDPSYPKRTIAEVAQLYNLPDLAEAIGSFIKRVASSSTGYIDSIGGRRLIHQNTLPISYLQVWKKVRIQSKGYHHPHDKLVPYTINASPPSAVWPYGQFDSVIFNIDQHEKWPKSGLHGK